jgi:hypothetical protein
LNAVRKPAFSILALATIAAAAAALSACQPIQQTVSCDFSPYLAARQVPQLALVPAQPGTMTPIALNSVSFSDTFAAERVLVQYTGAQRTPTGTVEVTTRMVNCTDRPLVVEGRTNFFDEGQRSIEPASAWQKIHLPPRSVGHYSEMSIDTKRVQTYLTELRTAP